MSAVNTSICRLVVLVSGRGSNLQAIVQAARRQGPAARVCAVVSSNPDAAALAWARREGLQAQVVAHRDYPSRDQFDQALAQAIDAHQPDYVLLAGFMRVLGAAFVQRFNGRLINIHPSLLPAFPGLHTHQQALATGVQWHGCTVHFVTPVLDHGPIVAQGIVPVLEADTPDSLAQRVLGIEHTIYAQVVQWLAQRRVTLDAVGRVRVAGVASRSFFPASTDAGTFQEIA